MTNKYVIRKFKDNQFIIAIDPNQNGEFDDVYFLKLEKTWVNYPYIKDCVHRIYQTTEDGIGEQIKILNNLDNFLSPQKIVDELYFYRKEVNND